MKGKTVLIAAVVLAASYPIATGDYRLIGLTSRVQAYGAVAAEHSKEIGKDIFEFIDGSQTQLTKAAEADDKDSLQTGQDSRVPAQSGLPNSIAFLSSPKSNIDRATVARHGPDSNAGPGVSGRFQVISSGEKNPPVMIDTGTGASWFLSGEMDRHNWIWSPIQHDGDAPAR